MVNNSTNVNYLLLWKQIDEESEEESSSSSLEDDEVISTTRSRPGHRVLSCCLMKAMSLLSVLNVLTTCIIFMQVEDVQVMLGLFVSLAA